MTVPNNNSKTGKVILSVDLGSSSPSTPLLESLTNHLTRSCNTLRLGATWFFSDLTQAAKHDALADPQLRHERALRIDAPASMNRKELNNHLQRQILRAEHSGNKVTSLLCNGDAPTKNIDLIYKLGLTSITAKSMHPVTAPKSIYYGVWQMPAAETLCEKPQRWWSRNTVLHSVGQTAKTGKTMHVMINLPLLLSQREEPSKAIYQLLRRIAQLRDNNLLQVVTTSTVAEELTGINVAKPQRSILRMAS